MEAKITYRGLEMKLADISARLGGKEKLVKMLNKFKVNEKPRYGKTAEFLTKSLKPYKVDGDFIYFPQMMQYFDIFLKALQNIIKREFALRELNYESVMEFYDYQSIGADIISSALENQHAFYAQLGTGLGKTMLSIAVFLNMQVPTLIVAPTDGLAQQWLEDFKKAIPSAKIQRYSNAAKNPPNFDNCDIIIIIYKTLSGKNAEFLQNCGLAIIDEAHTYISETKIDCLWLLQCVPNLLGLSATPNSNVNGLDVFPMRFLGNPQPIADMPGVSLDSGTFTVKVKKIEYFGDISKPWCTNVIGAMGMLSAIGTISAVINDEVRNNLIIAEIVRLRALNHGVMVFSELRDHLEILSEELKKVNIEYEISILKGGISAESMAATKKSGAHVVLTTYGYSRFGISLIDMTALIIATPHRNGMEQIIGRITRKGSDESIVREIVDIVDMNLALKSQYNTRKAVYMARKYPIS